MFVCNNDYDILDKRQYSLKFWMKFFAAINPVITLALSNETINIVTQKHFNG